MTKKNFLETIVNVAEGDSIVITAEMKEVATASLTALEKASAYKSKSAEKDKEETMKRAEKVYEALVSLGEPSTCTAIGAKCDYSVSRVSALLRKLGNRVEKTYSSKGVALYSIAE